MVVTVFRNRLREEALEEYLQVCNLQRESAWRKDVLVEPGR